MAAVDAIFMWMLHMHGNLSFRAAVVSKVYTLVVTQVRELESSALTEVFKSGSPNMSLPKFREALNNRKHPQKTGRGKVTMARYGAVASSPYTAPLISWQILEGTGETISKEAAELKVGQPGYWQLTDDPPEPPDPSPVRTSTGQAEAPAASLDSQHVVTAAGTGTLPLALALPMPQAPLAAAQPSQLSLVRTQDSFLQAMMASVDTPPAGESSAGASAWGGIPATAGERGGPVRKKQRGTDTSNAGPKDPPPAAPQAAGKRVPAQFARSARAAAENLVMTRLMPGFSNAPTSPAVDISAVIDYRSPYWLAALFASPGTKCSYQYYVGKPLACWEQAVYCWFPGLHKAAGSTPNSGTIESAGLFAHIEDVNVGPNLLLEFSTATTQLSQSEEAALMSAQRELTENGMLATASKNTLCRTYNSFAKLTFTQQGLDLRGHRVNKSMAGVKITDDDFVQAVQAAQ